MHFRCAGKPEPTESKLLLAGECLLFCKLSNIYDEYSVSGAVIQSSSCLSLLIFRRLRQFLVLKTTINSVKFFVSPRFTVSALPYMIFSVKRQNNRILPTSPYTRALICVFLSIAPTCMHSRHFSSPLSLLFMAHFK